MDRRPLPFLAFACALLLPGPAAAADEASLYTEQDYLGNLPEVLTATRLKQPALESPTSITVIDRESIVASGARGLAELLRLVPGFQVEYAKANRPVVTYHGTSDDFARRLQVLIDGRSVYTPIFGGVLWDSLPVAVEDVDRIEVIRAPNASSYGPNSFSAIINIITRHAASDVGNEVNATAGQRGQRDGFARANGDALGGNYRLSLEHEEDDGFKDVHDARDLDRLTGRFDRGLDDNDELLIQAGGDIAGFRRGRDSADPAQGDTDVPRTQDVHSAFLQGRWNHELGQQRRLSLQYYTNYDKWQDDQTFDSRNGFAFPGLSNPGVDVDLNVRSLRHDLELVYTGRVNGDLRVVAGTGARHEEVKSRWLFGTDDPQTNDLFRVFGHAEYAATPKTTVHLGALVENNDLTGTATSPKLAIVQETAPYQRLRLSVSYATRTPVLFEQNQERFFIVRDGGTPAYKYYTDFTERDLRPEQMRAVEIGYRIDPPGRRWGMDLKLSREYLDDLIVEVPTTPPASSLPQNGTSTGFVNGVAARIQGVEGSLSLFPTHDIDLRLWASRLAVDHVRSLDPAVGGDTRQDYVQSVPQTTAGMLGIYRLSPRRTLSLDYYYIDKMSWVDNNDSTSTDRLDLQYREQWESLQPGGFVALRLENLLGEYAEYDNSNVTDTRLALQVGFDF